MAAYWQTKCDMCGYTVDKRDEPAWGYMNISHNDLSKNDEFARYYDLCPQCYSYIINAIVDREKYHRKGGK